MSLEVRNLRKVYSKRFTTKPPLLAVDDISFQIKPGEIYSLLGPNGAGKSTTIKMIAGLVLPTSGEIKIAGKNSSGPSYQRLSAILEGTRNVYWRLTPLENLHYFANLRGVPSRLVKEKAPALLRELNIDAKKKNQSQHLSRGMLQKLALAAALITDPEVLLLDEPTLGLDVESGRKIKDMILRLAREEGRTILLTTHQMDLVEEIADRVGIINHGKLIQEGTLPELRAIFQSHIYRLRLKGRLKWADKWKKAHGLTLVQRQGDVDLYEIDLKDAKGVSGLLRYLAGEQSKNKKLELLSLHRVTDELEEIFLRVLRPDRGAS
ncbi:MAG: ABC transporter ATP-binding protein [Leptospiraceae bacterium]|nr:ABC transporter ATP-binding protein [Leptospiraceae bacterium]MCB1304989.1 ABC transporter ATP-binding protein [Leptospiraceae bacterium]